MTTCDICEWFDRQVKRIEKRNNSAETVRELTAMRIKLANHKGKFHARPGEVT